MLGELVGWFIGWDLLLEYTAIVAVVAISISGYFNELLGFLGIDLPLWMMGAPGTEQGAAPPGSYKINLIAVLLCLLIAFVLNQGMKSAARFESFLVYLKVAVVLLVVGVGVFFINTDNYSPFLPYGFGGAFTGAATVFFAVFGYDAMTPGNTARSTCRGDHPLAGHRHGALHAGVLGAHRHDQYQNIHTERVRQRVRRGRPAVRRRDHLRGRDLGILTVMFTFMGVTGSASR